MKLRLHLINIVFALLLLTVLPSVVWFNVTTSPCRMSAAEQKQLISHYRNYLTRFRLIEARTDVGPDQKTIAGENASRIKREIAYLENQN